MECKNHAQITFTLITTCGFFGVLGYMLIWGFPPDNKDPLNTLLGVLTSMWILQMQWFYGSSASGKAKDEALSEIAKMPSGTGNGSSQVSIPDAKSVTVTADKVETPIEPAKP